MRKRIFLKLLAAFLVVIAATAVTVDFSIRHAWENSLSQQIELDLQQKTLMFANRVNTDRKDNLPDLVSQESHAAGARATVIDLTGPTALVLRVGKGSLDARFEAPEPQP